MLWRKVYWEHMKDCSRSCLTLCSHRDCDHQASLSMGFPRQDQWSGLPFPSPGGLLNSGIEPVSPALADRFFTTEPQEEFPPPFFNLLQHWYFWRVLDSFLVEHFKMKIYVYVSAGLDLASSLCPQHQTDDIDKALYTVGVTLHGRVSHLWWQ